MTGETSDRRHGPENLASLLRGAETEGMVGKRWAPSLMLLLLRTLLSSIHQLPDPEYQPCPQHAPGGPLPLNTRTAEPWELPTRNGHVKEQYQAFTESRGREKLRSRRQ